MGSGRENAHGCCGAGKQMSEQIKNGERAKRIAQIVTILEARIEEYPHTWQDHSDLPPIMREYYNLTKDPAYQQKLDAQKHPYK